MTVMEKPPWETAIYEALRQRENHIAELEAERAVLLLKVHRYQQALREARNRLENWKLRQATWRREREQLLTRIRGDA